TLLTGSWIEFSLALPLYINARDRSDCPCAEGSFLTLICCVPVLFWSIGPALYIVYLRERQLSQEAPERPLGILIRKSVVFKGPPAGNVTNYVSSARNLSLVLILLSFVGVQVGVYNDQRRALGTEAREAIVIRWLKNQFGDDDVLLGR